MKRKTISFVLLASGIAVLLYAMLVMDVSTDGRIVNLYLLNIRQNLVIIGSIAALAGLLILYINPSNATSQVNETDSPNIIGRIIDLILKNPTRSLYVAFLSAAPVGAWLMYKWLFGQKSEADTTTITLGIILYFGPMFINRSLFINYYPTLSRSGWFVSAVVVMLFLLWILISFIS
jgi:hypothetical protein